MSPGDETAGYRRCASVVLLRPTRKHARRFAALLVRKPRIADAWQLPQGGIEAGESVEEAGIRELREETGIENVRVLGRLDRVYQYDYPTQFARFPRYRGQRIEFVAALAPASATVTVDRTEVVGYHWAFADEIATYVRRPEYRSVVESLMADSIRLATRRIG